MVYLTNSQMLFVNSQIAMGEERARVVVADMVERGGYGRENGGEGIKWILGGAEG